MMHQQGAVGGARFSNEPLSPHNSVVVNMPCADALNFEGLTGGEGKARRHEDQLNSDCTTGEGTKNKPSSRPRLRERKTPDRHSTMCPHGFHVCLAHLCVISMTVMLYLYASLICIWLV